MRILNKDAFTALQKVSIHATFFYFLRAYYEKNLLLLNLFLIQILHFFKFASECVFTFDKKMKKIIKTTSVFFAAGILLTSCGNNASNVPANAKSNFEKDFPGVNAKWDKEDSNFEASFKQNNNTMSALYDANGNKLETEQDIDASALPQNIKDYVSQSYKGEKIKEATIITKANGEINYEAEVKEKDLLFTKEGQFIKTSEAD